MIEKTSDNGNTKHISIVNELDILVARMRVREVARDMGFCTIDQARISLAASELARLLAKKSRSHKKCEIIISGVNAGGRLGIQVVSVQNHNVENDTENSVEHEQINTEEMSEAMSKVRTLVDDSFVNVEKGQNIGATLMKWLP